MVSLGVMLQSQGYGLDELAGIDPLPLRRNSLSLLHIFSTGLRSGEYGGRKRT